MGSKVVGEADCSLSEKDAERFSLCVTEDVQVEKRFTEGNVRSIRPEYGLAPVHFDAVVGCTAAHDLEKEAPLCWEMVS